MSAWGRNRIPARGLGVILALAAPVTAEAQMSAAATLGGGLDPGLSAERIAVPFAGTYAVTLALGRDTAEIFFRTTADAELRTLIAPDARPGSAPGATIIPGLSLLVYADQDLEALPYSEDVAARPSGVLEAPLDPTTAAGSWVISVLVGTDTMAATPAARLSRRLLEVRTRRALLERRCAEDPSAANQDAIRAHLPPVCDEEMGLPLPPRPIPGDGMLVVESDDQIRLEQRISTPEGDLTLRGERVSRTTLARSQARLSAGMP